MTSDDRFRAELMQLPIFALLPTTRTDPHPEHAKRDVEGASLPPIPEGEDEWPDVLDYVRATTERIANG